MRHITLNRNFNMCGQVWSSGIKKICGIKKCEAKNKQLQVRDHDSQLERWCRFKSQSTLVVTSYGRSWIQATEMKGWLALSLRDRVRSSVIWEPLLLHIDMTQLSLFGNHLGEVFQACPNVRKPRGRPRTHPHLPTPRMSWRRWPGESWLLSLDCCPHNPNPDSTFSFVCTQKQVF